MAPPSRLLAYVLVLAVSLLSVAAQNSSSSSQTANNAMITTSGNVTLSLSTFLSLTTIAVPTTSVSHSGNRDIPVTTVVPQVRNVTATATATISATPSATPTPEPIRLDTRIDPAFGVLGALLILTGLPSAFLGHKNRWTSFFLVGFYTLSLTCLVLILKFGVLPSINPPNRTVRGLFVLACGVAGVAGGGITIFFWKATRYLIGGWGGFALALWIQCFRSGGLISPIGLRWIMYIAIGVAGFVLCTIPKIHYHVLLLSTAIVGATSFILGIDCYTTGNLKEFYIWNLGFNTLFPKFNNNGIAFPVSQTMQIELGLMGAIALMGMAVQFQILKILQRKLREIKEEQRRLDAAAEARAARRFASIDKEREEWERAHPSLAGHGRKDSSNTTTTLMKDGDMSHDEKRGSTFTLVGTPRQRYQSGVSDFIASPPPPEELHRAARSQSPGALPVLDLGTDIEENVPKSFMAETSDMKDHSTTSAKSKEPSAAQLEDLRKKEALLAEIQAVRKSIEVLKSETPAPSSSSGSHQNSRRNTLYEFGTLGAGPSHIRPPREQNPRERSHSMELSRATDYLSGLGRPSSTPLRDEDWDAYVRERKLLQPPSGVTPPIGTTAVSPSPRVPVSPAVAEALLERRRRESALSGYLDNSSGGRPSPSPVPRDPSPHLPPLSSDDVPLSAIPLHKKSHSQGAFTTPGTILPAKKPIEQPKPQKPEAPRVLTIEELAERHREKIRQMQAPLTQAEKEQAELSEAKQRWERAKANEKLAVAKRQAEQAAALNKDSKKKRKGDEPAHSRGRSLSPPEAEGRPGRHSRALSADMLATIPNVSSSKRMSTLKVDDWQKHQLKDLGSPSIEPSASKRRSAVPFPDSPREAKDRRRTSSRDPVN
ncbi:hypothetical protein K474DRAFT_1704839 [Panus rudis PR-1116 ss-1]|nr:hypothetical protein K474DRAFT_1704839 [Panus rudis PR-1116 ss-1]